MPTIRATSLRLNLDKPEHKQAWEYLQALDDTEFKSYTSAIVTAVNDYFGRYFRRKDDPYLETREREEKFVAEIVAAVERSAEKALPSILGSFFYAARPCAALETSSRPPCRLAACIAEILNRNGNFSVPAQNFAPAEKAENDDISDVDLDFIGG